MRMGLAPRVPHLRSAPREDRAYVDHILQRHHAQLVPSQAELGAVDPDLGVELGELVAGCADPNRDGDGPRLVAYPQRADNGKAAVRRGGQGARGEHNVGIRVAVEEVSRTQVTVPLLDLRVYRRGCHLEGASHL